MKAKTIRTILIHGVLIISSILVLVPIAYAVSSSFKPLRDIFKFPVRWIPTNFTVNNYVRGWQAANFTRYFLNSILITVVTTASVLFFSTLTGFSLSKYRYPGRRILFAVVIVTLTIPIQVRVIPLYMIVKTFGWINTYWALIVPALMTSLGIFVMTQFVHFIPNELFDSARVDGCSEPGIFYHIVVPLSRPGLAALAIVNYMTVWNDYFWPLVVVNRDSLRTLSLGLAAFQSEYYTEYGQFFAVSLVVILPMVIVFVIFQKQFIRSVALSGIKG